MIAILLMSMALQTVPADDPIGDLLHADATLPAAVEPASRIEAADGVMAEVQCVGEYSQGGMIICRATPGTVLSLGDQGATADRDGWAVLGLNRDAGASVELRAQFPNGTSFSETHEVTQREYNIQRVDGVPPATVNPPADAIPRIRAQSRQKAAAYTSRWEGNGFSGGFIEPADGVITGVYGSQRVYNGEPRRPHYGLDFANETGTEVVAVADGIVTLAEADMYYEGGLIFIDHGQGFTSAFLHLSEVDVVEGQIVTQGERIGAIGSGGRSTGPHVDWRIKWRNRYVDPALVLQVDPSDLR